MMNNTKKFQMKKMYDNFNDNAQTVTWNKLFHGNIARPRAIMTLWLKCHGKFATKERLKRLGKYLSWSSKFILRFILSFNLKKVHHLIFQNVLF